ncbi:MAG: ABC transporter ATP-binding protein [Eubacteriales bacterium]
MMKHNKKKPFLFALLSFAKHQKLPLLGAISFGALGHLSAIAIPSLASLSLGISLGYFERFELSSVLALIAIFGVVRGVLHYIEQWLNHYLAFRVLADIRDEIFDILRKLAPAKLEGRDKGDLITLITSDIEKMEVFFAHTISPIGIAILVNGSISLALFFVDIKLGISSFLMYLVVGILIPVSTAKLSGDTALQFRDHSSALSSFTLENIQGMRELLQYGKTDEKLNQAQELNQNLLHFGSKMSKNTSRSTAITYTMLISSHLIFLGVCLHCMNQGSISFGILLFIEVLFMSSFGPVIALANLGSTLQSTFASAKRVLSLREEIPQVEEISTENDVEFNGISANELTFSYNSIPVLRNLSLELPCNKVVGIQGASGCGKSTFLRLLMRFWDVESGEILISDTNIKNINTNSLRSMQSYVTQETHLFSATIGENIRLANPNATQEELEVACKKASIHHFITSLEQGYDTPVGHLGDRLSGGERQRIGLARAFLYNTPLLLLDEPTSNLDSLNEASILRSIYQESADKTVVLVSHRSSTLAQSDILVEISDGTVVSTVSK